MVAEHEAVRTMLATLDTRRALDLGTGTGRGLSMLMATGAQMVIGADRSSEMLRHARSVGAPLVRADARALPFAALSFDLMLSSLMAGDLEDLSPWMRDVARVLGVGGTLVYSDFHPTWATRGWSRTFTGADGQAYALPFWPHSLDDHRQACADAGLGVVKLVELRLPLDGLAGTEAMRRRWDDPPIGVVLEARKGG
jgi:malonyl-CoA O-methyltransferase